MNKVLGMAVAVAVLAGAAAVYAGDMGCCAAGKKVSAGCSSACSKSFSKLNLTPEQRARIQALKDSCTKATSTSERIAMFSEGMSKILTPKQYAQWKACCDTAMKNGSCPLSTMPSCGGKSS